MAVLKLKYKRNGKTKVVGKWYIDIKDHHGISRRFPGYTDKGATEKLESDVKTLIEALGAGLTVETHKARQVLMGRDAKIRNYLIKFGLLDKTSAPKKLIDLVADFKKTILVNKSGKGYSQADQIVCRLSKIITDCRFESWHDVTADRINLYIHELDLKPQTKKFYIVSFRRFGRWIIKNGYGQTMPELKVVKIPRRPERHLEQDEYLRLLETTKKAPVRFGMHGWQRYLCYWVAVETGLRCNEMRQLTPDHIDFARGRVFVPGEGTKNSNSAFQNITKDLSELLKSHCQGLSGRIFNIPHHSANMIRADAEDAGIQTRTLHGRLRFHSLRHTCASFYLAATNGNMQIVSNIMRHSNITITVNRYGHMLQGTRESAVELMGKFTVPKGKEKGKAAG